MTKVNSMDELNELVNEIDSTVAGITPETPDKADKANTVKSKKGFYTINELAGMVERNPDTVRKQLAKASLKPNKAGKYSLVKVKEIFAEASKRDMRNIDPSNAKQIKTKLECEILQQKLDQLKGNLITKDDHFSTLLQSHSMVKQQLINLPKQVAQLTSDIQANQAVKKLVENLCNTLSSNFANLIKESSTDNINADNNTSKSESNQPE